VDGVSYAHKLTVEDGRVAWSSAAMHVDRLIRACTPDPGAWTMFRGERVKLDQVRPADPAGELNPAALAPGELAAGKHEVRVGTGTGPVLLGDVRAQGKRRMPAPDWARGVRVRPGERFE